MKNIEIKLHSIVDIITNSSTVIYVQPHDSTIDAMKELINKFLKDANSNKTADDLYNFKIVADRENESETLYDMLGDEDRYDLIANKIISFAPDFDHTKWKEMDYKEQKEIVNILLDKIEAGEIEEYEEYGTSYYDYDTRKLIITSKNESKETVNITDKISNIFEIDGGFDG